ncbi:UDP-4-amino-4,6-dideoxy-N-acetyl-beta-L-altrosamine N-acetyltransferase [Halobacillus salinarum]|uniref:UDP-4-amino-4, 6-dideoxy-N-acetyl-beta-L-altrosamine N-acetyltransferase n=1 Tax=Halobacillus salinarum TaxID=2932257 RepID=A0ABY4EKP9_9BACI|nr:UDP-4-amino-4,6-dideoxy-N-acetyl-beta-L-altrosamine N-acetyltransferase [Halobacillus salinarum]UOQ44117.1 UDP-4-amino-4,6-dideoxy-N-acetyl-beta-L-altrosamine N-acetyltransferase [Halobacillus salinarum]
MAQLIDYELITINETYLSLLLKWRNSDHIRAHMYSDHRITMEEHRNWYSKVQTDDTVMVKVCCYQGCPIGVVNINDINRKHERCYWGFYIGDVNAPKGSGTMMGILALDFIFKELKIRKLCAEVIDFNEKSFHYHKKLGFVPEGRFRNHITKNGNEVDVIPMALFADRWEEAKNNLLSRHSSS